MKRALDPVYFWRSVQEAEVADLGQPTRWQENALRSTAQAVLLCAARQSGKSSVAALLAVHRACYVPGTTVLMVSRSLDHSGELFRRALKFYAAAGRPVPPESETKLSLTLSNGSRIISRPGSNESTRGFTSHLLIIDEASRVPDELYTASLPVLAKSGGRLLALSTPAGKRGFFYEAWANGGADFERFYAPASTLPESWYLPSTSEFLARERRHMGTREFDQEYECSFEDDAAAVFPAEVIAAAFDTDDIPPLWPHLQGDEYGELEAGYTSDFGFGTEAQPLFPELLEEEKGERYFYAVAVEDGEERCLLAEGYDIEEVEEAAEEYRRTHRRAVVKVKELKGGKP